MSKKYEQILTIRKNIKRAGRSGTRSDLAELAFFVYFFSALAFQRNKVKQKMQKSKSQSRLERQSQTIDDTLITKEISIT